MPNCINLPFRKKDKTYCCEYDINRDRVVYHHNFYIYAQTKKEAKDKWRTLYPYSYKSSYNKKVTQCL